MTNKKQTKSHFRHGSLVDVVYDELTCTWMRGTVVGVLDSGNVHVKLTGGLYVTRPPVMVKHVETCGFCCTVKK